MTEPTHWEVVPTPTAHSCGGSRWWLLFAQTLLATASRLDFDGVYVWRLTLFNACDLNFVHASAAQTNCLWYWARALPVSQLVFTRQNCSSQCDYSGFGAVWVTVATESISTRCPLLSTLSLGTAYTVDSRHEAGASVLKCIGENCFCSGVLSDLTLLS